MTKFDIYTKVRWIRQQVGDKKEEMIQAGNMAEAKDWDRVEQLLDRAEAKLEDMNLGEELAAIRQDVDQMAREMKEFGDV